MEPANSLEFALKDCNGGTVITELPRAVYAFLKGVQFYVDRNHCEKVEGESE